MTPLIKWPGGKTGEIRKIESYIPPFCRYIEPFFGGGALFFHLKPNNAAINDISSLLIDYYRLIQKQDKLLHSLLLYYNIGFSGLLQVCASNYSEIHNIYRMYEDNNLQLEELQKRLEEVVAVMSEKLDSEFYESLVLDKKKFTAGLVKTAVDKMVRTVKNSKKALFQDEDLKNNLLTGFTSGFYMYFRDVFNELNLGKTEAPSLQYKAANFYFIREYCYGSMFRYNSKGEFNIPYGGISYNTKNFRAKIDNMFNGEVEAIFRNATINCSDFESFMDKLRLSEKDFIFLDPPYDTEFSDYEGREFTRIDQERLAFCLKRTLANFIIVIKNTDFIFNLYKDFNMTSFDNRYTYNVRSRNERDVEHLLICNFPIG